MPLYPTFVITIIPTAVRSSSTDQTRATTTPTATCCPTGTSTNWDGTKATTTSLPTLTFELCGSTSAPAGRAPRIPIPACRSPKTVRAVRWHDRIRSSLGSRSTLQTPTTPTLTRTKTGIGIVPVPGACTKPTRTSRNFTPSRPATTPHQMPFA